MTKPSMISQFKIVIKAKPETLIIADVAAEQFPKAVAVAEAFTKTLGDSGYHTIEIVTVRKLTKEEEE
jgi:hypothetical protein